MIDDNTIDDEPQLQISGESLKKIGLIGGTVIALIVITFFAFQIAKKRSGTVVLPGGTTYLGPSETPAAPPVQVQPQKYTADANVEWIDFKGKVYPFTFTYPKTLTLTLFPDDPSDTVGISWNNLTPQNNIIFRVADLKKTEPQMEAYISKPKKEYANNWWKQFSGLKGVRSLIEFSNSKGMKGYRVKFLNHADQSPNDDIFFEVPGRRDLMVRFANGMVDSQIFDKIVDSFYWPQTKATPTSNITTTAAP